MTKRFALELRLEALDKVSEPMLKMQTRIEAAVAPLQRMSNAVAGLTRATGLPRLASSTVDVGRSLGNVALSARDALRNVLMLGSAGVAAVGALVVPYVRSADAIGKQAARIGIGVDALQELRFAAQRAGVSSEDLDDALLQIGKRLGQAKLGVGPLAGMLSRSAPELLRSLQAASGPAAAFETLADAIAGISDQTLRAAIATAAFGAGGQRMLSMLQGGRAEISRVRAEARALGLVIGAQSVRDAEAMSDAFDDLRGSLTGVRNAVAGALLPALRPVIQQVTNLVVGMRPQIEAWSRSFAATLPERFAQLSAGAQAVWEKLQPLVPVVQELFRRFDATKIAIAVLAGPSIADLLTSIGKAGFSILGWATNLTMVILKLNELRKAGELAEVLTKVGGFFAGFARAIVPAMGAVFGILGKLFTVVRLLGAAMLGTPVGLVITGIAALVAAGWFLYENWDAVASKLQAAWGWLVGLLEKAWSLLKKITSATGNWIADAFTFDGPAGQPAVDTGSLPGGAPDEGLDAIYRGLGGGRGGGEARVRVDFANLPSGATVRTERRSGVDVHTRVGHSFEGA